MPLSPPKARRHLHTRTIELTGYYRDDGLFDIEAHIVDRKTYSYDSQWRGVVASGHPVHDMSLRLSVDGDLVVREVEAVMDVQPYTICSEVLDNFQRLVGLSIAKGFKQSLRERLGGIEGCTHVIGLLEAMGAAALQTFSSATHAPRPAGEPKPVHVWKIDALIDTCYAYRRDGPMLEERARRARSGRLVPSSQLRQCLCLVRRLDSRRRPLAGEREVVVAFPVVLDPRHTSSQVPCFQCSAPL